MYLTFFESIVKFEEKHNFISSNVLCFISKHVFLSLSDLKKTPCLKLLNTLLKIVNNNINFYCILVLNKCSDDIVQ